MLILLLPYLTQKQVVDVDPAVDPVLESQVHEDPDRVVLHVARVERRVVRVVPVQITFLIDLFSENRNLIIKRDTKERRKISLVFLSIIELRLPV